MPNVAFTTLTITAPEGSHLNLDAIHTLTHISINKRLRPGTDVLLWPYTEEDYEYGEFERFSFGALLPSPEGVENWRQWVSTHWGSGGDCWEYTHSVSEDDRVFEIDMETRDWYPDEWVKALSERLEGYTLTFKAYGDLIDGIIYMTYQDGTRTKHEIESLYDEEEESY